MKESNSGFQENRTLIAVVLTMGILFGWQYYLKLKYPHTGQTQATVTEQQTAKPVESTQAQGVAQPKEASLTKAEIPTASESTSTQETVLNYEDNNRSFSISSYGMGLRNLKLKSYKDREKNPVQLIGADGEPSFETSLSGMAGRLNFEIVKKDDQTFVGTTSYQGNEISKTLKINSSTYTIDTTVEVKGAADKAPSAILTRYYTGIIKAESGGMFAPPLEKQTYYIHDGNKPIHEDVAHDSPKGTSHKAVSVGAVGSHYFATGIVDSSSTLPNFEVRADGGAKLLTGIFEYPVLNKEKTTLQYRVFAGPKSTEVLKRVDPKLVDLVDFGWFSVLGHPILALLKWIFSVFSNYGIAIILLTLIVRMMVLPFNVMSYKSMKAMQVIQPQMQAVREKYKEDPQRMNLEVMNLMKTHKVNPLGGCLPVLLQLPVFFALYRVLGESIELYQAPFMLWISDLSLKDHYYVLPVLMGITMYVQQKITPTTMDPAQAKVMQFMPILFAFMMISLPSGLTLYIFVSTLFGIIQQKIFMRDKAPQPKPIQVTT